MASYVAVLRKDTDSDYEVQFPDLPGCVTTGTTLDEARHFAAGALALHLDGLAADGLPIPAPRSLDAIRAEPDHRNATLILVEASRP